MSALEATANRFALTAVRCLTTSAVCLRAELERRGVACGLPHPVLSTREGLALKDSGVCLVIRYLLTGESARDDLGMIVVSLTDNCEILFEIDGSGGLTATTPVEAVQEMFDRGYLGEPR